MRANILQVIESSIKWHSDHRQKLEMGNQINNQSLSKAKI